MHQHERWEVMEVARAVEVIITSKEDTPLSKFLNFIWRTDFTSCQIMKKRRMFMNL